MTYLPQNIYRLTILVILMLPLTIFSQSIKFKHLSADDGLSQNTIHTIIQDDLGFIWFGTNDGLNRYDGLNFKQFKNDKNDSLSISNNEITCSYLDSRGVLWFGTSGGGLNKYNYVDETFTRYKGVGHISTTLSENTIRHITEDDEGYLWIATDWGLNRYDYNKNSFLRFSDDKENPDRFAPHEVFSIVKDSKGFLWIGTWGQGLFRFNPKDFSYEFVRAFPQTENALNYDKIWNLFCDSKDRIWVSYWGQGICVLDQKTSTIKQYKKEFGSSKTLGKNFITKVFEDSNGQIYIGTDGDGLNILNSAENRIYEIRHDPSNKYSISEDGIESIYEDKSGVIWVGTWGGGVNFFDRRQIAIEHYRKILLKKNTLSHNEIRGFYIDKQNSGEVIWIATDGGGLNKFDRRTGKFFHYKHDDSDPYSIPDDVILSVNKEGSYLWIGSYTGGLIKMDTRTGKFESYKNDPSNDNSISSNFVRKAFFDSKGMMWIATNGGGLVKFDRKKNKFTSFKTDYDDVSTISNTTIIDIYEDSSGVFWVATHGGLNRFNPYGDNPNKFVRYTTENSNIAHNKVICIHKDLDNNLWFGTAAGLSKYLPESDSFLNFTDKDGLSNDMIYGILEDDNKNLWLSTNKGINKLNTASKEVKFYTIEDGLQSNQFYLGAYAKSHTGEFLFGGNNGFNIFHPDSLKENQVTPEIVITDIKLFNESLKIEKNNATGLYLNKSTVITDTLVINHEDGILTIEFAALHFSNPKQNQYKYILEGFEKSWNEIGNRNFATYTNLDPGEYKFRVIAANNNSKWNQKSKDLIIIVIPPFYQTTLFYIILAALTLFVLYFVYMLRVRSIRKFNLELKQKVKARTKKLKKQNEQIIEQSKLLEKQAQEIENTNIELEQINSELEARVEDRTAELLEAKNKAERADKVKSEFLAQMSHEIRTPVNAMLSYVGLFIGEIEEKLPDYLEDSVEGVQRSGNRIIRTIDSLINVAELQSNSYDFNKSIIDIEELLTSLYSIEFKNRAQLKNLQLEIINEAADTNVEVDKYSMEQVFSHLLDNAIKYTEKGCVTVFITENKHKLLIKISDTGIGIDPEYLPIIFMPFTQEEQGYTRKFEGNGLGLTIVKKFCELNNAEISVQSEKGNGTTFKIEIKKADSIH